jgi:hypothetical protein
LLLQKIRYFSRRNAVYEHTHAFVVADPHVFDLRYHKYVLNPYFQIGMDNGNSYPITYQEVDASPLMMLGSNWISYNTKAWPNGLPSLGDKTLIPGPTWKKETDNLISRSSLLLLNKLMPGYFFTRCVGKQVGE